MLPYTHALTHSLAHTQTHLSASYNFWWSLYSFCCVLFAVVKLWMCALDANFCFIVVVFVAATAALPPQCSRLDYWLTRRAVDLTDWIYIHLFIPPFAFCLLLPLSQITCMPCASRSASIKVHTHYNSFARFKFYRKNILRDESIRVLCIIQYTCMATHSYHHGLTFKNSIVRCK